MFFKTKESRTLLTDLYQLTMAQGYWKSGLKDAEGIFHLYFRHAPFGGSFAIAAGLEQAIEFINDFKFSKSDIDYLSNQVGSDGKPLFDSGFLKYLKNLKFTCTVDAVLEGNLVFPNEPLLTISGSMIQAQLLETPLLNIINFQTLIATKAARLKLAAGDDPVFEFGLRRAQGDGGIAASRAAYIGGCEGTSNVLAGKKYGIPIKGTQAHSWVMSFNEEVEAFKTFLVSQPNNASLLIDTYDTMMGVLNAEEASWATKIPLASVRLDSGDLTDLSKRVRASLDRAGFKETKIIASNDLDEWKITLLKDAGAKIDIWGVGTALATGDTQPALGGVYKLAAIRDSEKHSWRPTIKLSQDVSKTSNPGNLNSIRVINTKETTSFMECDLLVESTINCSDNEYAEFKQHLPKKIQNKNISFYFLSTNIFIKGKQVYFSPPIKDLQLRTKGNMALLPKKYKNLKGIDYPVHLSKNIKKLKADLIKQRKKK